MKNEYLVTKEGLEKIKEELRVREGVKKDEIKKNLEDMRAQGDLRENDGYTLATEAYKANEQEISRLKDILKNAKIVKAIKKDLIEIGDIVTVVDSNGKESTFKLGGVGEAEANVSTISNESPIGKALIGKKLGAKITVKTPRGDIEYTVTKV